MWKVDRENGSTSLGMRMDNRDSQGEKERSKLKERYTVKEIEIHVVGVRQRIWGGGGEIWAR